MTNCQFVSDLHGHRSRYEKLFSLISSEKPDIVFIGGDILPHAYDRQYGNDDFFTDFLEPGLTKLKASLGDKFPRIMIIMGNDDPAIFEENILDLDKKSLVEYIHNKETSHGEYSITGYSYVPPTPFMLKDWERYDVSQFDDVGVIPLKEGRFTRDVKENDLKYLTIADDLNRLSEGKSLDKSIYLFHSPPYGGKLDRAALDGKTIDHVPVDVHVGSIAIQRFIESKQPYLTLHGHVHESTRLTGEWREKSGRTWMFNSAHGGPELAVIRFLLKDLDNATYELI